MIKIYDNGKVYEIDEKDIYDPFPDPKKEEPKKKEDVKDDSRELQTL